MSMAVMRYRRTRRLRAVFSLVLFLTTPLLPVAVDHGSGRAPAPVERSALQAP